MSTATATQERFRFRCKSLRIDDKAAEVKESLLKTKGVIELAINKRVGSVLVIFDKAKTSAETLFVKIAESLGVDVQKVKDGLSRFSRTVSGRKGRRIVKRGMMGAGVAAIGLLAYSEKGHAISGGVWLTLLAAHLYQNKRTLFS